ncbi:Malignant T-cell-amplified sequence 1, partial [Acropora cervicornis]
FQAKESVSGVSQVKSSVQRGIKSKLVEQFPAIDDYIVQILPRKEPLVVVKCHEHIEILSLNQEILFFRQREGDRNTNKGIGIEVIHFLNDGLWQMKQLEK